MTPLTLLILSADEVMRRSLKLLLPREGFEIIESSGADLGRGSWKQPPDLIIAYVSERDSDEGLDVIRKIRRRGVTLPVILVTSYSTEEIAVEALRLGVSDYLKMPVSPRELAASVNRSLSRAEVRTDAGGDEADPGPLSDPGTVSRSSVMGEILAYVRKVARTDCTVLVTGETGTGKELVVNLLHRYSPRSQQPLVVINCAAIPDTLLESELFGHERGAFTGAYARQGGAIQAADQGTLFLDEIGDTSPMAQAKILRALENKEICPVGGRKSHPINVRFVAATNKNLEELVTAGEFRADLYYRLNMVRITLPPLRERRGDIELLLDHFRRRLNRKFRKEVEGFTEEAMAALLSYDWPGNVRELKNFLEATFINAPRRIDVKDFPPFFQPRQPETASPLLDERNRLLAALFNTNWNKTRAAQQLQWSRMTLYRKMAKYHLTAAPEKPEEILPGKGESSCLH